MLSPTWQGGRRGLVVATSAYLANAVVATWVAMSNDFPGRPFGVAIVVANLLMPVVNIGVTIRVSNRVPAEVHSG